MGKMKWSKDCFGNVRTELEKNRKELVRVEKMALQRGYSNNLIQLKKEIIHSWIKKRGCGAKGHALCISKTVIIIPDFSIAEQLREDEEIL